MGFRVGNINDGIFPLSRRDSDEVCQMIESTTLTNTHHNASSSSHGGGPMVNAMNGRLSAGSTPDNSNNTLTLSGGGAGANNQNSEFSAMSDMSVHDFEFFPSSNYDIEDRTPWTDRPESRHSLTSAPSPMNPFSHASPAPNPPSTPFSGSLPFSPIENEMKEGKDMMMADVTNMSENCESARLRNLLTNKKSNSDGDENANRKQILENLLNSDGGMEIDGGAGDAGPSPSQRKPMTPSSISNSDSSSYKSGSNVMLLKVSVRGVLFDCLIRIIVLLYSTMCEGERAPTNRFRFI